MHQNLGFPLIQEQVISGTMLTKAHFEPDHDRSAGSICRPMWEDDEHFHQNPIRGLLDDKKPEWREVEELRGRDRKAEIRFFLGYPEGYIPICRLFHLRPN